MGLLDAYTEPTETINFCLDKQSTLNNENLAKKYPEDFELLSIIALRIGLCELIDKRLVSVEDAIDIFETERRHEMMRRIQEEQTSVRRTDT